MIAPEEVKRTSSSGSLSAEGRASSTSLLALWLALIRNWRFFLGTVGMFAAGCLVYCLFAPKEYEAVAKVELRSSPESLFADRRDAAPSGSFASGQVQLETLANVLRSEQLGWDVITRLGLYKDREFSRRFQREFPGFSPDKTSADAKEYLLRTFRERLRVEALPHTLVLEIRFRSQNAAMSAAVVNELIEAYGRNETDSRMHLTRGRREWLDTELRALKQRVEKDDVTLAEFQRTHGIVSISDNSGAHPPEQHSSSVVSLDALNRELLNATTERILREAEYRAAASGDGSLVFSTERGSNSARSPESALLQQLYVRRSELQQEETRLAIEHGSNFPRLVEIRQQMETVNLLIKAGDVRLVESFRIAWRTALDREALVRRTRDEGAESGLKLSGAALKYATMSAEANANREVYVKLMQQSEEAGLAAGSRGSALSVIDYARQPGRPVSPNLAIDMAIAVFGGVWLGLAGVLAKEAVGKNRLRTASLFLCMALTLSTVNGQAPTPSTSGLPTGVAHIPQSSEMKSAPNPKEARAIWSTGQSSGLAGAPPTGAMPAQVMDAPIAAGDMLEVTAADGSDLHVAVRVSQSGTVILPLCGEVKLEGMDERSAAHAIEVALKEKGMLLRPQVAVLVIAHAGLDVSVLGEVTRPGVYNYAIHHRLLDLISAASGLNQNAGRLVTITRRNDPGNSLTVVLDPSGLDASGNHNPELLPGDTVQVGRAGLVYVVGDVIRPGGFPVDPVQAITVVQALSLAWGPAQNAALKKAVLIREQPAGRTVTTLNLKRMLRGLDPDVAVRDRDILFVPDSMAKNLVNRTLETNNQTTASENNNSGLVYSQRF